MSFLETFNVIKSLIKEEKFAVCKNAKLSINEKDKKAKLKTVHITSVGSSAFSIKLDECAFPGQVVFNTHPSMHRACDAVAFCEVDGKPYIICCELKSSEPSRQDVAEQFRNAHCFLFYLDVLLKEYCSCEPIKDWPRRYFVFHNSSATPLDKQPLIESYNNSTPEHAHFMPVTNNQDILVRKLLNKPLK